MNLQSTSVSVLQLNCNNCRAYAYNYTGVDPSTQLGVAPNETPMRYPKGAKCCCHSVTSYPMALLLTVKIREHS